jgi:2'-5' RNA ligase
LGSIPSRRSEMVERSARVAEALHPFVIRLGPIDFLDEYFRCLFVRTLLSEPQRRAYQAACRVFGCLHKKKFMPHLSLLYGNFTPDVKREIIAEIGPRLDVQFRARSVDLYRTHGEPRNWRRIASFNLS